MTISPRQIRAARALLDWHQKDLAERADVSKDSIKNIENEITHPQPATLEKIKAALELAGVSFTEHGVELRKENISFLEGDDWFVTLLEDVHNTLSQSKNGQLLIDMGSDAISAKRPSVMNSYRKIREAGIEMRQTICEGDSFMIAPTSEYRWIPKAHFKNWVELIYGDKVAISINGEMKCMVIKDENLATRERMKFELLWKLLKKPDVKSTAHVSY